MGPQEGSLKPFQLHKDGGQQQEKSDEKQQQEDLPEPLDPHVEGYPGNAEGTDEYGGGGGDHVGDAVAELVGHHCGLAGEADDVGEGRQDGHGEGRLGRPGGDEDVDDGLHHIHAADGEYLAGILHQQRQRVEDSVDDPALGEDLDDAPGKCNDECCREHILHPGDELLRDDAGGHVVGDAGQQPHGEKERRDLLEVPAVAHHAGHQKEDGEEQQVEDEELHGALDGKKGANHEQKGDHRNEREGHFTRPRREGGKGMAEGEEPQKERQEQEEQPGPPTGGHGEVLGLCLRLTLAPVGIGTIHGGELRLLLHPFGIEQGDGDCRHRQYNPAEQPVADAGEEGQPGEPLCDADGEGVERGAGEAYMGGHIDHHQPGERVVSHGDGQRHDDDHEGERLLAHPEDGAKGAEEEHHQDDHQVVHPNPAEQRVLVEPGGHLQEGVDAAVHGTAAVEDLKGTADDEHEGDDGGLPFEAGKKGGEDLPALG